MELLRRISGSSTSSADDMPLRRSLSLGPFRRKSSKDSSRSIRRALKDQIREFNSDPHHAYTSAPQTPLIKSRAGSFPDPPEEDVLSIPRSAKPATERMYSHGVDDASNHSDEDLPLGVAFTGLSPRRESAVSIPLTLPRLPKNRRISEHIDPMSMASASSISIPRSINWRRKSEVPQFLFEEDEEEEGEQENEKIVQKETVKVEERFDRIVPQVSVLPDAPVINSASSSLSVKDLEARGSIVSFFTTNSSAPSPTARQGTGLAAGNRKILPYIPDDETYSYDLLPPGQPTINAARKLTSTQVEDLAQKIYSKDHLRTIVSDPTLLYSFSRFIESYRPPESAKLLTYYLDAQKAIKAINYANAIAESLGPSPAPERSWINLEDEGVTPVNKNLQRKTADAFKVLAEQELPRYVAWVYTEIVSFNVQKKITGSEMKYLQESANELAEVFCLTDPQRPDNPIIFASEEFHRTTQYPISYVSGRNCRFLQGPKTQRHGIARLRDATKQGLEITECFLNYKRDGTPFMNLVMVAPLLDAKGKIRYFIGAQIDVTSLVRSFVGLEGFKKLMSKQRKQSEVLDADLDLDLVRPKLEEFKQLSELFSAEEIEKVKESGGQLHKDHKIKEAAQEADIAESAYSADEPIEPLIPPTAFEDGADTPKKPQVTKKKSVNFWSSSLKGVYRNYILVRPNPSLRILFASPSMRTPGILQSPLMSKIGGTDRVREELESALNNGRGITVKVRWLSKAEEQNPKKTEFLGRERWLHCTPLFGPNSAVGVWMIVIVDDETTVDISVPPPSSSSSSGPEYGISDLPGIDLGIEKRPVSGSDNNSYRLSADFGGLMMNGNCCAWYPKNRRRKDAPVIQNAEEWRNQEGVHDWVFDNDSGVDEGS
ncbi:hypothetical protein H072_8444 [Dactylellina haptotyla CBS 200.50]|uniref:PAC domain-containing protein n=1 Tax=Dactylellina haptotyla (strain CBS 200.50) TaxID=1284197 RepID=S8A9W9_DACHA|nr:hypothetical protein H072_8444 [Dactylellina haptotyla CBS 200.50]